MQFKTMPLILLGLQQLLSGDLASIKHPIRLAAINLIKEIDPSQSWFGIELLIWMAHNSNHDLLNQFEIDDAEGFIPGEMIKWDGAIRRHARRFVESWTKRYLKKTKERSTT